jgi:proline iminopeptidase
VLSSPLITTAQWEADADSMAKQSGTLAYSYMWGPSEFTSTGTLKHFDATGWLAKVTVPTLFVTGEFDEATPASTERFAKLVPGAEFKVIPNSGHMTHNDNPDAIIAVLRDFFRRADGAR